MNDDHGLIVFFGMYGLFWLLLLALFVLPSFIAFRREHPNRWLILAINIFLGGTGIGWGVALIWALNVVHLSKQPSGSHGGESGLNLFANDVARVRVEPSMQAIPKEQGSNLSAREALEQVDRLERLLQFEHITESEFKTLKESVVQRIR